jgi:hypothetical protein
MFSAAFAVLFQNQLVLGSQLVFESDVVLALAIFTDHRKHDPLFFFCHLDLPSSSIALCEGGVLSKLIIKSYFEPGAGIIRYQTVPDSQIPHGI